MRWRDRKSSSTGTNCPPELHRFQIGGDNHRIVIQYIVDHISMRIACRLSYKYAICWAQWWKGLNMTWYTLFWSLVAVWIISRWELRYVAFRFFILMVMPCPWTVQQGERWFEGCQVWVVSSCAGLRHFICSGGCMDFPLIYMRS
jgi:hypothetical protein